MRGKADSHKAVLSDLFARAVAAVSADAAMPRHLPVPDGGRLVVIAIGKAAVPLMAAAQSRSQYPVAGLAVAPHGHVPSGTGWPGVAIITAGHPVPDADSMRAAEQALALATGLGENDHLLVLVSGGGSALLAAPVAGVTLADKAALTTALLHSGAAIAEINSVRKALSRIKGGRLGAAAAPAGVTTWAISDIPGDDPALIASGPTIGSAGGIDAAAVVALHAIAVPSGVAAALATARPVVTPTAKVHILARARDALDAVACAARDLGYAVVDLGDDLQDEARTLGTAHAALALRASRRTAIISGGETRVTVTGAGGLGGRNLEYALALAIGLNGAAGITALAADSDGIDGSSHAAGACIGPDTLARARTLGLDPGAFLAANDAHGFFEQLGDLVVTGPTLTNVNDIRIILID